MKLLIIIKVLYPQKEDKGYQFQQQVYGCQSELQPEQENVGIFISSGVLIIVVRHDLWDSVESDFVVRNIHYTVDDQQYGEDFVRVLKMVVVEEPSVCKKNFEELDDDCYEVDKESQQKGN